MDWPLSQEQEDLLTTELSYRAWTWAQDCNPFELNHVEDILAFIPAVTR